MKILYIILLSISVLGCSKKTILKSYLEKGYIEETYEFSDNRLRNIKVVFLSQDRLLIKNNVSREHAHNALIFNFSCQYLIEEKELGVFHVTKLLECNNVESMGTNYLKPYQRSIIGREHKIFPNILDAEIRMSNDFSRMQILDFSFEIESY